MIQVGITGNIGSGKSTVCRLFELLQVPIYRSDEQAKYLMETSVQVREALCQQFGDEVFLGQALNREYLAKKVFSNPSALAALNGIVHPAVFADYREWISQQKAPITLKEAALLVESGSYKDLDVLILVSAPEELRLKRAMERDNKTRETILARMKHQLQESELRTYCQYEIINDGSQPVILQVAAIHQQLLQRSASN